MATTTPAATARMAPALETVRADLKHIESYRADWAALNATAASVDGQQSLREAAWQEFLRLGFPIERRGNELWKYTDIRAINDAEFRHAVPSQPVADTDLQSAAPHSDEWRRAVFVDGVFSPKLSTPDVASADPTAMLPATDGAYGKIASYLDDPFVALNTAFADAPAVFRLGDAAPTLHLISVTTGADGANRAAYPRLLLAVDADASATIVETHLSLTDATELTVPVVEIDLLDSASLTHYRLQLPGSKTRHVATTRVRQAPGSSYYAVAYLAGAAIGRHDVHCQLDEGADSTMHGIYITNHDEHQANEVSATHAKPHATCDQFYKGILSGKSQAVFSGKIVVERDAQKADASQKDLNLLLSHGAEIDTKPSLEIYADDVLATHGATAGHVDEDTLFYLQSRGIDGESARAMLIRGFASEILDEFAPPELQDFLNRHVDRLMPQLLATSDTIGTA